MRKEIFRDISEMSDSREVLSERPHKFVSIFVYIIIALIAVALVWAIVGELDVYVRAQGEVRPNERVSTIRNTFPGRIVESSMVDGIVVRRGELLLKVDVQNQLNTIEILERQYESFRNEMDNLELLRTSILSGENLFDRNDVSQMDYYFIYLQFLTDTEFAIEQVRNTNLDIEFFRSDAYITRDTATLSRNRAGTELNALNRLLESIERGENLVPRTNAEHYRRFEDYQMNIQAFENVIAERNATLQRLESLYAVDMVRLDSVISERTIALNRLQQLYELDVNRFNIMITEQTAALGRLERLYAVGGVSRVERDAAQTELNSMRAELDRFRETSRIERESAQFSLDSALLEQERFIELSQTERDSAQFELDSILQEKERFQNETTLSVLREASHLERNIADFNASLRSAESALAVAAERGFNEDLVSERHRLDMLTSISDTLFTLQNNRNALEIDLENLRFAIIDSHIIAPIDGTISMFSEINVGDFVQVGTDIATIIPAALGEHRVMLAVSNEDIADIAVGQEINFRFAALPFNDFGEMTGRVTRISADAHRGANGQSYFLVETEMDGGSLYDRHGDESQIMVGMIAEARVITRSQRIIHWVLERLNFID
jgi:HlyD family secretion protein